MPLIAIIRGALRNQTRVVPWPAPERAHVIGDVCMAIRLGFFDEAYDMLDAVRASASRDAAWLNLVGVVHEWRGEWKMARRCYGRAIGADGQYEPAQQNMRRLYELRSLGHCVKPVALGDEVPALIALLRTTEAENATRRGGGAEEERSNSIAQRRGETETQRR